MTCCPKVEAMLLAEPKFPGNLSFIVTVKYVVVCDRDEDKICVGVGKSVVGTGVGQKVVGLGEGLSVEGLGVGSVDGSAVGCLVEGRGVLCGKGKKC